MKQMLSIFVVALLFTTGCNTAPKTTEEKTPGNTSNASTFKPYQARLIELTVQDFDSWYTLFKMRDSVHNAYGLTNPGVGRELDNDKKVLVITTLSDLKKARDFDNSPDRQEALKKSGTVAGAPGYWNVIMDDTSHIPQMERLAITYHVKDYDTWKKTYDAEGDATRAANGLVTRLIARGVDDPNMLTLFFAITDMNKAKARTTAPDMKKMEADAGIDSPAQTIWFKWMNM